MTAETFQDPMSPSGPSRSAGSARKRRMGTGIFLILLGALLALDQWHQVPFHDTARHWPLLLIAFGAGRLVDRGLFAPGPHAAILTGVYFELGVLGHHEWARHAWPLGLVWIGLIITLRSLRPRSEPACGWFHE